MSRSTLEKRTTNPTPTLYLAMELSKKSWKLAFSDGGQKVRTTAVHGGAVNGVLRACASMKLKFGLPNDGES